MKYNLEKNIIIFYHEDCLDGFTSAYVAFKKFKNKAEYIALSYTAGSLDILKAKKINIKDLTNKEIYFLDFCLKEVELKKVLKVAKKVIILDHHIGAKDLVLSVEGSMFGDSDKGESGAVVAHKYFFPKLKIPELVKYVGIGDTRYFSKNEKIKKIENSVSSYLHSLDFDFKFFSKTEKDLEDKKIFEEKIKIGETLNNAFHKMINHQVEDAKLIDFEGHKVYAVNASSVFRSELGNILANKTNSFSVVYRFLKDDNRSGEVYLALSLRGVGKFDLSNIAKAIGGGGHKNAAAARIKDKKFIEDFINKIIS